MRGIKLVVVAIALTMVAAGALSACGGDDDSSTAPVERTATATGGGTASGAVETTPGGAVVPAAPSCSKGQIYSQGSGACVAERQGGNPCPAGEVPAADQPVCEPRD